MRRETQNILLVLVGGALLKISITGAYLQYVKPSHRYWLLGGGAVMLVLALVSIARDLFGKRATEDPEHAHHDADDHDDHDVDGHQHQARSAWLLVVPVLAIFLIAPPALGADSINRADTRVATTRVASGTSKMAFSPLPPGNPVPVTMSDFSARASFDSLNSLTNREVQLTGFIAVQGKDTYLARLVIACCAADAFPVKVKLAGGDLTGLTNDTWLHVVGRLRPGTGTLTDEYVSTLDVRSITRIHQPENPYET
ncbi:TIGR03943 family putative permease subunit [Actinokineospora inagensis]|uniref:TIGR03943 family putative permease subunit n=1 Tax=Actinokineospora inagensis TaxID=103730 RepID=UPI00047B37A4|nr:TIGR03943 family protein [Actinokineospora inagensis]